MAMSIKKIFRGMKSGDRCTNTIHYFGLKSSDLERDGIIRKQQNESDTQRKRKHFNGETNEQHDHWYFTGVVERVNSFSDYNENEEASFDDE